jgi:hypothetical protein
LRQAESIAFNTFFLPSACTCCCASMSPVWQFSTFSPITYWLSRLAMEPAM